MARRICVRAVPMGISSCSEICLKVRSCRNFKPMIRCVVSGNERISDSAHATVSRSTRASSNASVSVPPVVLCSSNCFSSSVFDASFLHIIAASFAATRNSHAFRADGATFWPDCIALIAVICRQSSTSLSCLTRDRKNALNEESNRSTKSAQACRWSSPALSSTGVDGSFGSKIVNRCSPATRWCTLKDASAGNLISRLSKYSRLFSRSCVSAAPHEQWHTIGLIITRVESTCPFGSAFPPIYQTVLPADVIKLSWQQRRH